MNAPSDLSGPRSPTRPTLLTAAIVVVSIESLVDLTSIIAKLSGKPVPIPVVASATILAAVLAVAAVALIGFQHRGYILGLAGSALSGVLGLIGVLVAPSAPAKSGNGLQLFVAVVAILLLTRPATKDALT
jgi:hypothetical protein